MDTIGAFKKRIEAAKFTNIHETLYEIPVSDWVKDQMLKEAGRFSRGQFLGGMEGYIYHASQPLSFFVK